MKLNKKNKLLLLGFVIAIYICYSFAISNTITYYNEYQSKKEITDNLDITPDLLGKLHQKEKQLDQFLSKYNVSESYQSDLLKHLTTYSNQSNLKIIDFKEPHIIKENNATTSSYIFSIQGGFNGCLLLINKIENNPALGEIKHIQFLKKRNYKSNLDELFVEVVLQKTTT
jgi:hypothetical protein